MDVQAHMSTYSRFENRFKFNPWQPGIIHFCGKTKKHILKTKHFYSNGHVKIKKKTHSKRRSYNYIGKKVESFLFIPVLLSVANKVCVIYLYLSVCYEFISASHAELYKCYARQVRVISIKMLLCSSQSERVLRSYQIMIRKGRIITKLGACCLTEQRSILSCQNGSIRYLDGSKIQQNPSFFQIAHCRFLLIPY